MIKDVQGVPVKVGDKVAFAGGGRGASEFYVGYVIKITGKGVKIEYEKPEYLWDYKANAAIATGKSYKLESQRSEGMFAIVQEAI